LFNIQGVPTLGRGNFGHAPKVLGQQFADLGPNQVIGPDLEGREANPLLLGIGTPIGCLGQLLAMG
jgi:hypothetical protein